MTMPLIRITLPANEKTIPVHIGSGSLSALPAILKEEQYDRLIVLCDKGVESIAKRIAEEHSADAVISVPSGESSKQFKEAERLAKELVAAGATRRSIALIVGGGMMTDLGGFVCSIYMRGIRFISVPTSLLCMVDASVGGKTGVDLDKVKNLAGTFAHPLAILMDTEFLSGLPDQEYRNGLVEVLKMAFMLDAEFFAWLEENMGAVLERNEPQLLECIERAVRAKISVVQQDERESDKRMLLNFGHTVGHALETHSGFGLSHGQSVSRGMVAEMQIARTQDAKRLVALLETLSMSTDLPSVQDADALWKLMEQDKKASNGEVRMAVPVRPGEGAVKTLTQEQFRSICV